jgi:hypothetical protein
MLLRGRLGEEFVSAGRSVSMNRSSQGFARVVRREIASVLVPTLYVLGAAHADSKEGVSTLT